MAQLSLCSGAHKEEQCIAWAACKEAGTQTQDCGVQTHSPGAWGNSPRPLNPRAPGRGWSIWGEPRGPSPSLRQVPELLCHQSKPTVILDLSSAGRRDSTAWRSALEEMGKKRDAGGYGHRWGVLDNKSRLGGTRRGTGRPGAASLGAAGLSAPGSQPESPLLPPPSPPCPTMCRHRPQPACMIHGLRCWRTRRPFSTPCCLLTSDSCAGREGPGPLEAARGARRWPSCLRPGTRGSFNCVLYSLSAIDSPFSSLCSFPLLKSQVQLEKTAFSCPYVKRKRKERKLKKRKQQNTRERKTQFLRKRK